MRRRELLLGSAILSVAAALGPVAPARADDATPFDSATVRNLARNLAQQPYKAPDSPLPDDLTKLDYQAYRSIRFDPGHALWRGQGLKFTAEFFHRGFLYKDRVDILRSGERPRDADPLQPRPVHLRQGEAAHRGHRFRRLPPALPNQPP